MAIAVAAASLWCVPDRAAAAPADSPSYLLFAGTDLWRYGDFLYGGALWSPGGVNAEGFALKALIDGGRYSYASGGLHETVNGTLLSGALLPGWRFVRNGFTVTVFAGPVLQDYRLSPYDPGSRLHGFYAGAQSAAEIWYQPTPAVMASLNGSIASIGPTGMLRAAAGYRLFDALFAGPEAAALWCGNFQEFQAGAHITAWRYAAFEWSAAGGWSRDSDRRAGPYLRLSVSTRF